MNERRVLYSRRQPGDDERKSLSSSRPLHPGHQSQSHFARHSISCATNYVPSQKSVETDATDSSVAGQCISPTTKPPHP